MCGLSQADLLGGAVCPSRDAVTLMIGFHVNSFIKTEWELIMKRYLSLSRARRCFPFLLSVQAVLSLLLMMLLWACTSEKKPEAQHMAVDVTVVKTQAQNVPVSIEFVGQTQSSHQVEIRARVEGFLEKRTYEEGSLVKAGQVMFQMDRRPFEASLQEAKGELAQQQARWDTAKANLARIQPLAAKNAVSKKDLDDAVGNEKSAAAAVISAQGKVRQTELSLSYTTIASPVGGASGQAKKQEGSYIYMGPESLLTYVAKLDPIWVTFSVSENERMKEIEETKKGTIKLPPGADFSV
jgi:membrane fusion protein, multidrug efflux system